MLIIFMIIVILIYRIVILGTSMLSVLDIANKFITFAKEDNNNTLDFLKIQKLCFIAYGRYLAKTNKKLFNEKIEAWKSGPVIPDLYTAIKKYNMAIKKHYINVDKRFPEKRNDPITSYIFGDISWYNKTMENILYDVWYEYKDKSGFFLVGLTHQKGTPWERSYTGKFYNYIPDEYIKEYYLNQKGDNG